MRGRHLRRRFSLQPSFMKDDSSDDKSRRDKLNRNSTGDDGSPSASNNVKHKIVVMGAAKVGKTSIITRFLYNTFNTKYKRTIEEMHQGNFPIAGVNLTLDILDTAGSYEFPAMRALSISSADAFILVYDVTDASTFEEVRTVRDQIHETKGSHSVPIVVVGNKIDLLQKNDKLREVEYATTETVVTVDWENGFVEASAAQNENITEIFKELLSQAKIAYNLSPAVRRRRQSLPHQLSGNGSGGSSSAGTSGHCSSITMTASNVKSHAPTPAQLQHLQRIQEHSLGAKRNSCIIS